MSMESAIAFYENFDRNPEMTDEELEVVVGGVMYFDTALLKAVAVRIATILAAG